MTGNRSARPRTTRTARLLWSLVLAVGWALGITSTVHAFGTCPGSPDAATRELIARDPLKALEQARTQLASLQQSPAPHLEQLAALYETQAESYTKLELDAEARDASGKGLALVPDARNPLHIGLQMAYAVNVYDQTGIESAIHGLETTRALLPAGSVADLCLQITLGRLQFRQNYLEPAILNLTQAYRATSAAHLDEERVLAAEALSAAMRSSGDYPQALALNQEVIDWETRHGATLDLSVSEDMRGAILMLLNQYAAALEVYTDARKLSVQLGDQQGVAFEDLHLCEVQIELGHGEAARPFCESALRAFQASHSADMEKESQASLARLDLEQGHPDRALAKLNEVLDHGGADLPAREVASLYQLRARANAAVSSYRAAYGDLDEYVRRYVAVNDAERSRQVAALRARFQTDQEIDRNTFLKRELDLAQDKSARQKELLRWTVGAIVAGGLIMALLTYILVANLLHRRELLRLASQDGLTGLPNRRHTAELARQALRNARDAHRPLTLGIIDLDRFKAINDRYGHAAGDQVLMAFAHSSRSVLRATDLLGRWGGEEFLVVLPDTTLDTALAIVERLREVASEIRLASAGDDLRVSISVGVATNEGGVSSLENVVAMADSALYEAKNQGRDLICVADPPAVKPARPSQSTAPPGGRAFPETQTGSDSAPYSAGHIT
jgi:diguanylate cyclase (GGDEF)-like protein